VCDDDDCSHYFRRKEGEQKEENEREREKRKKKKGAGGWQSVGTEEVKISYS